MKVAILTQPLCNNYGGILQNYALQAILRRLGHEPVTLNTPVPKASYPQWRLAMSCGKRLLRKYLMGDPAIVYVNPLLQHRKAIENATSHQQFIEQHIQIEEVSLPLTRDFYLSHNFDAYVVGSDQVWRPRYNQYLSNFYLDFTQDADVRRVAYAASFGVDEWESDRQTTSLLRELAQKFDGISVREQSGVSLCRENLGVDAEWVLDPTMLLTAEDYLQLVDAGKRKEEKPYIGVYLLDLTKEKVAAVERLARKLSLDVKYLGRMTRKEYPSVESWLAGIANAECVVTDSFHGTVFSIIFKKQFLTIGNYARGNARFESLLSMFDLMGRLVAVEDVEREKMAKPIDYNSVGETIIAAQNRAIQFITTNIPEI